MRKRQIKDITKVLRHEQVQEIEPYRKKPRVSQYTIITYDLAIAKVAKQIQCEEYPTFDSIFVMFGTFHVE